MAKRTARQDILYRIRGLHQKVDDMAQHVVEIETLSKGQVEILPQHTHMLLGVLAILHDAVDRLEALYRGDPESKPPLPPQGP